MTPAPTEVSIILIHWRLIVPRKRSSKKNTSEPIVDSAEPVVEQVEFDELEASDQTSVPEDHISTAAPDHDPLSGQDSSADAGQPEHAGPIDGDQRRSERHIRRVKTIVHFRESVETSWKEIIEVQTVSRNGAALVLSQPCGVGRIISLVMEMPREFRLYDHFAEVYPVAGVVQNCMEAMSGDTLSYHVGVAFIGKQLPVEHRTDPTTTYRINGVDSSGLWSVVKATTDFKARRDARFWQSIPITVSFRDEAKKLTERAVLTTRDVSRGGAAIWGPLDVEVGDRVKVSSKAHDFFSMAKVCNRTDHPRDDAKCLVHLQFEGSRFPIDMLARPREDPGESESALAE